MRGAEVMTGRVAALYRHPVKGFTPERLMSVDLAAGAPLPCDRLYAVERGASGFDPEAPAQVSKWRFTVLANHPRLACVVTRYDEATAELSVQPATGPGLRFRLDEAAGQAAFADWLTAFLGDEEGQPLRVLASGPSHRFMDDAEGFVSLINLESLRAFSAAVGRPFDPLRMRANLYVDGWGAWAERAAEPGAKLRLGDVEAQVVKSIPRCIATHVDPVSGERDLDVLGLLREHYGRIDCGLYLRVTAGGQLRAGDAAVLS